MRNENIYTKLEYSSEEYDEEREMELLRFFLRCRYARTELITSDLICPSTYQLLWNSGGDYGPDLSFDKSASLERLFSSAHVLSLSSSSYFPAMSKNDMKDRICALSVNDLKEMVKTYRIPLDLHPRLPNLGFTMDRLPADAIGAYFSAGPFRNKKSKEEDEMMRFLERERQREKTRKSVCVIACKISSPPSSHTSPSTMGGGYLYFCSFYGPSSGLLGLSPDTRDRLGYV
nr:hypothetical protein [Tanacetum cinerariifolium]